MDKSKIKIIPKSYLGKCSVFLIIMLPVLFFIGISFVDFYGSTPSGETVLKDVVARPGVAIPMLSGFLYGIAAFFCGIVTFKKNKDFSILVIISTTLGFLTLLWVVAEIALPH